MTTATAPETKPITAPDLMTRFAERTGLTGKHPQRRYLWTDAFAVCNFLGLGQVDRAIDLVARVHRELGRHRSDDSRCGWLSGLADDEAQAHPTRGGLRIGKLMPERDVDEPFDDSLEWERDGQYFHYLTKWMYALDQLAGATRDPRYSLWSRELAEVAHRRFVYDAPGSKRMYWKMSVDLTRPQVPSMGHHDPLDGYVTSLQLEATARQLALPGPDLAEVTADYKRMTDPQLLATADPLGIGGLLVDAFRLTQIDEDRGLRDELLAAARVGLASYLEQPDLAVPAEYRLAFRELGLAIGLAAIDVMNVSRFERFAGLREAINAFWLEPEHRRSHTYRTHEDINDVMLATSLAPTGLLALQASAV